MNKHDALKELGAVLRQSPAPLSKLESGPAPLSPRAQFLNANTAGGSSSSLGSSLLSSLLSGGGSSGIGSSLLGQLLGSGGSGSGSKLGGLLGLGASPLISGLASLFGGGKSAPPPLNLYSAPQRVNLQAGLQNGSVSAADYSQSGTPRSSQPQITLHVQAMDSKSILDRSSDIAQAVRQAMLQSHPINDVMADL
jgi:hypothetical protein